MASSTGAGSWVARGAASPVTPERPHQGLLREEEVAAWQAQGRTWRLRGAVLALTFMAAGALSAVWLSGRSRGLRQHVGLLREVPQKWQGWGQCDVLEKDVAYLFTEPLKHYLEKVPTADTCCKYCQSEPKCKSWSWIEALGRCYMEDGLPAHKTGKKGFWSGLSRKEAVASPSTTPSTSPISVTTASKTANTQAAAVPVPVPVAPSAAVAAVPGAAVAAAPGVAVAAAPGTAGAAAPGAAIGGAPASGLASGTGAAAAPAAPAAGAPGGTPPAGGAAIKGGTASREAFAGFLKIWRASYQENDGSVPEVEDVHLPRAFKGIATKIVISSGGAAGGVVTEGMGYGIMAEGFMAASGDKVALANGIGLMRGWIGMVYGPDKYPHPFGGGNEKGGATKVDTFPYGVSAVPGAAGGAAAGVAGWKFPVDQCFPICQGSATDGDEDAVLGMIYLAAALGYPEDFVDLVMRAVIAFASADLGFPDLYRTLPDGRRVFVPKGGSQWGGLLPEHGDLASSQEPWCYNPSYFAPGHYRVFRDFASNNWKASFDKYLPPHMDGIRSTLAELSTAYNGAVTGGYNVLYYSSCSSGAVANWVGVKSECPSKEALNCPGVPWATTPYVGAKGECTASGTTFGSYGPDACRTPWRIAMDYILYNKESANVTMYDRAGRVDTGMVFNAQVYLNRMANQYKENAQCDAAKGDCTAAGSTKTATFKLAVAFDQGPHMTCDFVPNAAQSWWAAFMAWPTFTAFVAPLATLSAKDSAAWLDTFASICSFTGSKPQGDICASSYFELGQEVIATMVMSGAVVPLPERPRTTQIIFKK